MFFLKSPHTNPFFNIALESWLFENSNEDFFIIYINEPSVIVGKNQNAQSEVNIPFVAKKNIPVIRRISGGGTVYHDLGNINYSIITNSPQNQIDFKKNLLPIIRILNRFGLNAEIGKNNELLCKGFKISGSAQHIRKGRTLHHGTMLFDSDLNNLNQSIGKNKQRFSDKSIPSNISHVENIKSIIPMMENTHEFFNKFESSAMQEFQIERRFELNEPLLGQIQTLQKNKFETTEWIWGHSPDYRYSNRFYINNEEIDLSFSTKRGIIKDVKIENPSSKSSIVPKLCEILSENYHKSDLALKLHQSLPVFSIQEWIGVIF